jgi:hypothetical protein
MRAATRQRMISIMVLVLVISNGFLVPKAAAQSDKYSKMAPVDHATRKNMTAPIANQKPSAKMPPGINFSSYGNGF